MDVRFYNFFLQLNNYLVMMQTLSDRFINQENSLAKIIQSMRQQLPKELFDGFFNPIAQLFEDRAKLMDEMGKVNGDFMKVLQDYNESFKGTMQ